MIHAKKHIKQNWIYLKSDSKWKKKKKSPEESKINNSMRTLDIQLLRMVIKAWLAVSLQNFLPT